MESGVAVAVASADPDEAQTFSCIVMPLQVLQGSPKAWLGRIIIKNISALNTSKVVIVPLDDKLEMLTLWSYI